MVINSFGSSDVFQQNEIDVPQIKPGHVLVKIAATSVNTVDTMIRQMGEELGALAPKLPAILGMDFAGTIEAIGEGVVDLKVGDEVYGCAGGLGELAGTLAEFMLADANLVAKKPTSLTMKQAAALPLVAITAYEGLKRANIQQGQKVLVHGGAGGVGHVALQIAKHLGADVYATGSKDEQLALIQDLGATPINYTKETVSDYVTTHTGGNGFDIVYDSVGGENMLNSFEAAALNGQIASTVSMVNLDLTLAHFKGLSLHVVFMLIPMLHNYKREQHRDILNAVTQIVNEGGLTPVLDSESFSLEQVGAAHDRLNSGKAMGKVVVEVN